MVTNLTPDERESLEMELRELEAELAQLWEDAKHDRPGLNEQVWSTIDARQLRRAEIQKQLSEDVPW